MLNYYNNIDVLIISSISETGPNPLLEAMSCGVPVISNKVGLAPTIIKNNVNGILIDDMENIESYKNNIIELINNKEKYYMLSENSERDIQNWDWKIKSQGFKKMIDDYLNDI